MRRTAASLQRLGSCLDEFRSSRATRGIDAHRELRRLDATIQELEKKANSTSVPRSPIEASELWEKWQYAGLSFSSLSHRDVRYLCCSADLAMRLEVTQALRADRSPLKRLLNFYGYVNAYFLNWRDLQEPETVEDLIRSALSELSITRSRRVLEVWKNSDFLFSAGAARRVAEHAFASRMNVEGTCETLFLDRSTKLAVKAEEILVDLTIKYLLGVQDSILVDESLKWLEWIRIRLLVKRVDPAVVRLAFLQLIESNLPTRLPEFRKTLVKAVIDDFDRMGDPRIARSAANWSAIPIRAREKILSWLATETLDFFFQAIVPATDKNRRRAVFWLDYARRPGKIKDFRVALSSEDLAKVRISGNQIPPYSTTYGGKSSAFIMVFDGTDCEYVVIEFSETGNAAYIFERTKFEQKGTRLSNTQFHIQNELKRQAYSTDKIVHGPNWEFLAKFTLSDLGINL